MSGSSRREWQGGSSCFGERGYAKGRDRSEWALMRSGRMREPWCNLVSFVVDAGGWTTLLSFIVCMGCSTWVSWPSFGQVVMQLSCMGSVFKSRGWGEVCFSP